METSLRLTTGGVLLGILGAYAAERGIQTLLADVSPADVPTFFLAAVLVALAGSFLPAMRAVRVNPTTVMRAD